MRHAIIGYMNATDIAWLAGIFEGEGNMSIAKNGGTRISIGMADRDVIDRVNAMFPCTTIQVIVPKPIRGGNQPRTIYTWRISNPVKVREILTLVLPQLGERRAAKAREVLAHLDSRPGTGGLHRLKTHCPQGHEYTPENTYVRKGTTWRHCRACLKAWDKASRERRSLRGQVISA